MTAGRAHDLGTFARATGYDATPCRSCADSEERPAGTRCTNCGGSGRIWTSVRGSLSDDGLARLRGMLQDGE